MNYEVGRNYKFVFIDQALDKRGNPYFRVLDEANGCEHIAMLLPACCKTLRGYLRFPENPVCA